MQDSYWILLGLLRGNITSLANNTLLNFMDQIELFGYIPNGARKYYLNRSQPPVFLHMVDAYIAATNDTSILPRALRAAEREMQFWANNRTITLTGPSGQSHNVSIWNVTNSAPRPEGYVPDFEVTRGLAEVAGPSPALNESRIAQLYSNLASGAESGQDYSGSRWFRQPLINRTDTTVGLRTLNVDQIVPVGLNSILYRDYVLLAQLYNSTGNSSRASYWTQQAQARRSAVIDFNWDPSRLHFYDYNRTAGTQNASIWTATSYYPYWSGIFPDALLGNETAAEQAFRPLAYNGSIPASLIDTGEQWDAPSSWPPLVWISIQSLVNLPSNLSQALWSSYANKSTNLTSLPSNVFGTNASTFIKQPVGTGTQNLTGVSSFDELGNVGPSPSNSTQTWRDGLARALAQRYISASFCSWYSTGGSIPDLLPQADAATLNATNSAGATSGHLFEAQVRCDGPQRRWLWVRLSMSMRALMPHIGEYTVVDGFGWTNGVILDLSARFGGELQRPECPPVVTSSGQPTRRLARRRLDFH